MFVLFAGLAMAIEEAAKATEDVKSKEHFSKKIDSLVAAIRDSKKLVIYEGLPHQHDEADLLKQELKSKKTVTFHKFPFYESAIMPEVQLAKQLTAICGEKTAYKVYGGPYLCGGYHPDWCLVFGEGKETYQLHICLGCAEARLFGPQTELVTDLNVGDYKKLLAILEPLQKNRPASKNDLPEPESK